MKKPPTGGGFEDWSMGYRYPLCFMLGCKYELEIPFVLHAGMWLIACSGLDFSKHCNVAKFASCFISAILGVNAVLLTISGGNE